MSDLHLISTKDFLKALGGPTKRVQRTRFSVEKMVLAVLRLRDPAPTPREMLEDYVYGWDENGGALSNSIGVVIARINSSRPRQQIKSAGHRAGYFLKGAAQ